MLLSEVVRTSEEVGATRARRAKIARLADCLRRRPPEERAAGASFLAGEPPPGRIGVGWAMLTAATPPPSAGPASVTVGEADAALRRVAAASGAGSRSERAGVLAELLAWQTGRLLALETERHGHVVTVRPELVVEVACDGIQASPRYPGGVTLRFARVKAYRPDKSAGFADTIDTVRGLGRA